MGGGCGFVCLASSGGASPKTGEGLPAMVDDPRGMFQYKNLQREDMAGFEGHPEDPVTLALTSALFNPYSKTKEPGKGHLLERLFYCTTSPKACERKGQAEKVFGVAHRDTTLVTC